MRAQMTLQRLTAGLIVFALIFTWHCSLAAPAAFGVGRETRVPDLQFQPIRLTHAVTIREAVDVALRNYPAIAKKVFQLRAAKANVALAKTQYLPNLNIDVQESAVSPNTINSVVMNNVSGFDTVPVDSGPSVHKETLKPYANNLQGLNFNWLLIDQGLRHANDNYAYADARTARADVNLTRLDVGFDAADAFLSSVAAKQVIISARAALEHMQSANQRAKTLVAQGLRPGAETADWNYEVAKARIALVQAEEDTALAMIDLAEKMGVASEDVDIVSEPLIQHPAAIGNFGPIDLTSHPLALFKSAEVDRWQAKQVVLDKAYRPHLWLNSSVWGKGSGDPSNPLPRIGGGTIPQVFNYMVGLTYSFAFLEYFPLKAQRQMARSNELAARADFNLAMQILERKDARARVRLSKSLQIAEQTPELVEAARVREIQVLKRYSTGLTNMVALAAAEKALAEAQVQDAVAQVNVWRAILALAYAQGDLRPFLQIVQIAEGDMVKMNQGR